MSDNNQECKIEDEIQKIDATLVESEESNKPKSRKKRQIIDSHSSDAYDANGDVTTTFE